MGRETQMDGLRTMGNYCLVSFPADFDSYPVPELETRGGGMGLRFAYGLANAVSTANISRMDEGDEFHNGGGGSFRSDSESSISIDWFCRNHAGV